MYSIFRLPCLGIIGAGTLAKALTKGWVAAGTLQIHQIWASGPSETSIYRVKQLGCEATTSNVELVRNNQVVCLAAKPQVLPEILKEISPHVTSQHLLLSFAAGLGIEAIESFLPPGSRVARLMTNTPVQFREGVSSFTLGTHCIAEDKDTISQLMKAVGYCTEVKEELLDTVTGFAGGGPAYAYCFIEAIADGAVLGGMNRREALEMATKTMIGAARMIEETRKHPGQLKDEVCSAGGSTIHGIRVLEQAGMRGTIIETVQAASARSKALGVLLNGKEKKEGGS